MPDKLSFLIWLYLRIYVILLLNLFMETCDKIMVVKRSSALYNGTLIGIESIYTIREGKQISIPGKLEKLRELGRNNELFCPCGCGANLLLVAGQKRRQHFRIKSNEVFLGCCYKEENEEAIESRIELKCWLDAELCGLVESRVPICSVDSEERKYEFSFLSKEKSIAVCYCYDLTSLSDKKISILENNKQGIKVFYIVDELNGNTNYQYPEKLMKIQNRQGYCLLLSVMNIMDRYVVRLNAVYCWENAKGLWKKTSFASGLLEDFHIDKTGGVVFENTSLDELLIAKKKEIAEIIEQERETERREQQFKEEKLKRLAEEQERQREYARKEYERREQARKEQERKERERREQAAQERREQENILKANIFAKKVEEEPNHDLELELSQHERPVYFLGKRMYKCKFCGKIGPDGMFLEYGGSQMNLGICRECSKGSRAKEELNKLIEESMKPRKDENICPICGGILKVRWGRNGEFIGCSNFPNCKYTRRKY